LAKIGEGYLQVLVKANLALQKRAAACQIKF
jgi:hypothetical protein